MGHDGEDVDTVNDPVLHDLVDDAVWSECVIAIENPGASITCAGEAHGPGPLRGITGKDRYGLSGLTPSANEDVWAGTLLAVQIASELTKLCALGLPWVFETPGPREGQPSMLRLDEFVELLALQGVRTKLIDQCMFGARAKKGTILAFFMADVSCEAVRCNHPIRSCVLASTGETHQAPHPRLCGKEWAVPAEGWDHSTIGDLSNVRGQYITQEASAYLPLQDERVDRVCTDRCRLAFQVVERDRAKCCCSVTYRAANSCHLRAAA